MEGQQVLRGTNGLECLCIWKLTEEAGGRRGPPGTRLLPLGPHPARPTPSGVDSWLQVWGTSISHHFGE